MRGLFSYFSSGKIHIIEGAPSGGQVLKLQRYDFGGRRAGDRNRRGGRGPLRQFALRGLALTLLILALFGAKRYASALFGETPDTGKVAVAGFASAAGGSAPELTPASGVVDDGKTPVEWLAPMRNYPRPDTFSWKGDAVEAEYAPDSLLNARVALYLQRYRPELGVILVSDLRTGHVLAMGEREDSAISATPRLAYGSGFPAASLAKILTATAALECNAPELVDSIPQVGGHHTLYRRQLKVDGYRNVPRISLEEAFSRSVNPAFGMLGLSMGPKALRATAERMGFNRPLQPSAAAVSRIEVPDTGFSLAETACGFTARTTITPWHALHIARGAGDDGRLRPCTFVRRIRDLGTGREVALSAAPGPAFVSPANLPALQAMMQATVRKGTSRKGFHQNLRASHMDRIDAGGKTGSLDGVETPGRFDWFIGYVRLKDDPGTGLAFSVMLVHREYAGIHASAFTALLIRDWLAARDKAMRAAKAARADVVRGPDGASWSRAAARARAG